ncbi:MAG: energy transducer TonB [Cytophagales bacterium]|nr:MAG: energy transducer TonB [Cytophagales bacterium]
MNRTATFLLLLLTLTAVRAQQQPIFSDFEVSQPAEVPGGMPALQRFMAVNVRKPFLAQVANVKGMAIVQGVIEPDGHISEVSVARSLRPDCDREAVRAFALFNAWKPAQKDGKPVRQRVTFPIRFAANEPISYQNGIAIQYFDNAFRAIAQPDSAVLRSETPTDTLGVPTGNLVFFRHKGDKWKKEAEMKLVSKPDPSRKSNKGPLTLIGHMDEYGRFFGRQYWVDEIGAVYDENIYDLNRSLIEQINRDKTGLVRHKEQVGNAQRMIYSWYHNGQIQQMLLQPKHDVLTMQPEPDQMLSFWDFNGTQTVVEGNGAAVVKTQVQSLADTNRHTTLIEEGAYERGLKTGRWQGKHIDGSYWYEESYNKGQFISGRSIEHNERDTVRYDVPNQQPSFKGGQQAFYQFLGQNLRYPADAQRAGAQGRVFVKFVVCTDGTLCDFEVLKGIHPDLDQEAIRVVKAMKGRWTPGTQRGRPVKVKYNLPLNFTLE